MQTISRSGRTTDELILRARYLRNAAPQQFLDFMTAVVDYTNMKYRDLVDAGANIQQAQGHAQQCKVFLQVLDEVKNG
jgi:hypothetical protein